MTNHPNPGPALVEIRLSDVAGWKGYNYDTDEPHGEVTIGDMVAEQIASKLIKEIRDSVQAKVQETVNAAVKAQVDVWVRDALAEPIQRTNDYGRPVGEAKSMPEFVGEHVTKWFSEPADRYDSQRGTRVQKMIYEEVDRKLKGEMTSAIREAKAAVVRAVSGQAGKLLADAIKTANLLDS